MLRVIGVLCVLAGSATVAGAQTGIPDIRVECETATAGPMSLFCNPARTGQEFSAACGPGGVTADATINMRLLINVSGEYEPVANFPREDIWLESSGGELMPCPGGTNPDAHTDADGRTRWRQPLAAGGHLAAGAGEVLHIMVNGDSPPGGELTNLSFNSADMDGDLAVNIIDVHLFAVAYFAGWSQVADFRWDGEINLSDVVMMARSLGADCP